LIELPPTAKSSPLTRKSPHRADGQRAGAVFLRCGGRGRELAQRECTSLLATTTNWYWRVVMTSAFVLALTITTTPGLVQFTMRVYDYVETHRRLAAAIEQPLCSEAEELTRQADVLGAAIRDARPRAKEGDIFTLAASEMFRARIAAITRRTGFDVAAFLDRHSGEAEELEVHVFGALPWRSHVALMPIIRQLPELPPELEYRFVGRHLVLMDVGANIVVDVLRDALPLPVDAPLPVAPFTPCAAHPELDACWM
jgi:hypothetical protein